MATPNILTQAQQRNQQSMLIAVASADDPAYTEEKAVPLSVDLDGNLRIIIVSE